jgi:hypothetical protein
MTDDLQEDQNLNFPRTEELNNTLVEAGEWAQAVGKEFVGARELLIALLCDHLLDNTIRVRPTLAAQILRSLGIKTETIAGGIIEEMPFDFRILSQEEIDGLMIGFDQTAMDVIKRSISLAQADNRKSDKVETPHLLIALLEIEPPAHVALARMLETDITATFLAQAWQQLLEDGEEENFQEELAQGKSDETKAETPTVFGKSKTTRNPAN